MVLVNKHLSKSGLLHANLEENPLYRSDLPDLDNIKLLLVCMYGVL